MSPAGDDARRILRQDLRRYLEQRLEDGVAWYFDPGPGRAAPPAVDATRSSSGSTAPISSKGTAVPPPRPTPAARALTPPASPKAPAPAESAADRFARECEAFVAETLALIARQGRAEPVQSDIFTPAAESEPPLDRAGKAAALAALAAEVAPCELCKLCGGRTQTVFGVGDPDAGVVFVGEAPGRDEDLQGEPFVGRAGQLLNEILKAIGFAREDVYICNILKCRPPNNRDPEADEVTACEPYLKHQLAILEPRIIVCLGRVAAQTLLKTRASLSALRERVHFYGGIPVMATYHPAALLRNPHWKRPTWDDVRKLRALHDALENS